MTDSRSTRAHDGPCIYCPSKVPTPIERRREGMTETATPGREPITPEPIRVEDSNYSEGHWDYPRRCANVEAALTAARERVEEWDQEADAHGWWHERPHWIALHNEVLRLRQLAGEG